jgi:hypothetical protein
VQGKTENLRPFPDQHRTRAAHTAFGDAPVRHEGGRPAGREDGGDLPGRRSIYDLRCPGHNDDHRLAGYRPLAARFCEGIDFRFLRSFWLEKGLYMTAWRRSFTYLRVRTYGS